VKPQFKTRIHEAAISRTLNLVRKDEWNVIEDFYEPGKEFVYFENERDLDNKINDVLNNWGDYEEIVSNAYDKSLLYTTERFVEKIDKETK
jgi:spore maturation protein CgeB